MVLRPGPGRRRGAGERDQEHDAAAGEAERDEEGEALLLAAVAQDLAVGWGGRALSARVDGG